MPGISGISQAVRRSRPANKNNCFILGFFLSMFKMFKLNTAFQTWVAMKSLERINLKSFSRLMQSEVTPQKETRIRMRANKQRLCFGAKDMCNGFIAKPAYETSTPRTAPLYYYNRRNSIQLQCNASRLSPLKVYNAIL